MPVIETRESAIAGAIQGVEGYLAEFERSERILTEPAGLTALRRQAIARFAELGFPTLRQEEWRLTNVAPVTQGAFRWPESGPDAAARGPLGPPACPRRGRLGVGARPLPPPPLRRGRAPQGDDRGQPGRGAGARA